VCRLDESGLIANSAQKKSAAGAFFSSGRQLIATVSAIDGPKLIGLWRYCVQAALLCAGHLA